MEIRIIGGVHGEANTYILLSSSEAAVVDPSADISRILDAVGDAKIKYILLTHGHFDHFLTLETLRKQTHAPVCIHRADARFLTNAVLNCSGPFLHLDIKTSPADKLLRDKDRLCIGNDVVKVISSPGHTDGSVIYECGDILVCGDTLFSDSYGRYDLPGGDPLKLSASLDILADRRDDPVISPGHGDTCRLSDAKYIVYLRTKQK
ncbi:MAG: MBL fold metallo-hydrolase [Eubacteriales bacterium]